MKKELFALISVLFVSNLSQAYCAAKTTCRNGTRLECGMIAYNDGQFIVNPSCTFVNGQSVSCTRPSYNGLNSGASIYKECSLYPESDDDNSSSGNGSYIPGQ